MPYIGNQHNVGDHVNNFKVLDDISSHTATFDGSAASVIDTTNNTIRVPLHRFIQGQRVTYTNGGGGNIGGLTSGTAYFVSFDTANTIKLATTLANANNNTVINISAVGSGTSHTLNAAFDGVNTKFKMTHGSGKAARLNNATQLNVAINNVIQRPNQSALSFTEGFALEDNHKIVFKVAPTVNDIFWGSIIANTIENFDLRDNEVDNFTGDGSATEFTLSTIPANNESVMVTIDGVLQHPSDKNTTRAYTLINSIIQFTAAPALNAEIQVRHIGFAGASTADVSGFYGRTGNVALTSSDHITTGDITSRNINSSGIVTAATFDGSFSSGVGGSNANFTGIVTAGVFKGGDIEGRNLKITGLSTFVGDASFTGNVSIGGTLTYEDVTNIDSVGIITAQSDVHVGAGVSAVGVGTFGSLDIGGDIDVDGHTNLDNVSIAGIVTANTLRLPDATSGSLGRVQLGNGFHFSMYHDGNNSFLVNNNGYLSIQSQAGVNGIFIARNAEVNLYHGSSVRLQTSSVGVTINRDLDVDGHTNLDNLSIAGVTTSYDALHIKPSGSANSTNVVPLEVHANKGSTTTGISTVLYHSSFAIRPEFILRQVHNGNWNNSNGQTQHWRMLWKAPNETDTTDEVVELKPYTDIGGALTNFGIRVTDNSTGLKNSAYFNHQQVALYANNTVGLRISQAGIGITDTIYHEGDTDTKIRFPANDTIRFETAGSQRLNIASNGNISITNDLDVDGHTNLDNVNIAGVVTATTFVGALTGTASGNATISSNASNRIITGGSGNALTGNSDLLWNGSRLDIDTGGTEDALRIGNTAGADTFIRLGSIATNADTHAVLKYDKDDNYVSLLVSGESHGNGGILIANGGAVSLSAGTSPLAKLHVKEDIYVKGSTGDGSTGIQIRSGTSALSNQHQVRTGGGLGNMLILEASGSNGIFQVQTGNGGERFRITSGGQVRLPNNGQELTWGASQQIKFYYENSEDRMYLQGDGAYGIVFRVNSGNRIEIDKTTGDVTMQGASGRNFQWDNSEPSLYLTDNGTNSARLKIGSGGDLQLYHDVSGNVNHISAATNGEIKISANQLSVYEYSGVTQRLRIKSDGSLRTYTDADGVSCFSNNAHGNIDFNHRGSRVLHSNGTGWGSPDGQDPILVLAVENRAGNSDIGNAYGLCLHSESQDDSDYGPLIGWSNRSNSGSYNTTYAAIVGRKTAQGADSNWSAGELHFFTSPPGGYMNNDANLKIDNRGRILSPRQVSFYATANSGGTVSMSTPHVLNNWRLSTSGKTFSIGGHFNTSNGRFTAPVDGRYLFTGSILLSGYDQASGIHVSWRKNGTVMQYWYNTRTSDIDRSGYGGYLAQGSTTTFTLSANDYVDVNISFNGSLSLWCGDSNWGHFSGHLLG